MRSSIASFFVATVFSSGAYGIDLPEITDDELQQAVLVTEEAGGEISLAINPADAGVAVRVGIRKALEGLEVFDLLLEKSQEPATLKVWNRAQNSWKIKPVMGRGALIGMAMSAVKHDQDSGRRYFLKDGNGEIISVVATTNASTYLAREAAIIAAVASGLRQLVANGELAAPVVFLEKLADDEPPHKLLVWDTAKQSYQLVSNEAARQKWMARADAITILSKPAISALVKTAKTRELHGQNATALAGELVTRPEIAQAVAESAANQELLNKELVSAITGFLQWTASPDNSKSFKVHYAVLKPGQHAVGPKAAGVERIAFVYPDGNEAIRTTTARNLGATVYSATNVEQSIGAIEKHYKISGKPVEVLYCSHGCGGYLDLCQARSSGLSRLIARTRGLVARVFTLGCHVGHGAGNVARVHVQRDLAVGLSAPVSGVDQMLQLDGNRWYIGTNGNLVTVLPTDRGEIEPATFVSRKPVWLERR